MNGESGRGVGRWNLVAELFGGGRVPLFLAPMAGVTDLPFRLLAQRFGADATVSEMIASQAMVRNVGRCLQIGAGDGELLQIVQLAGGDPAVLAEAARMNVARGARAIDLNMGCPVKKIVKSGGGAALLRDEPLVGRIVEAVARAVAVPVSVKIRLGWDDASRNGPIIARIAQESGAAWVTVHGRTRAQFYTGRADWRAIGEVKAAVTIPVIGNGDVCTPEDGAALLRQSGADGVMIGRGALGRPWIFARVARHLASGEDLPEPGLEERVALVGEHLESMLAFYGEERGNRMARKHLSWFTHGMPGAARFRERVNRCATAGATRQLVGEYLSGVTERYAA